MRTADAHVFGRWTPDAPFELRLRLQVPHDATASAVHLLKPFVDGVISAFHDYVGPDLDRMSVRLAEALGAEQPRIRSLLAGSGLAVLGPRRVIARMGRGHAVEPGGRSVRLRLARHPPQHLAALASVGGDRGNPRSSTRESNANESTEPTASRTNCCSLSRTRNGGFVVLVRRSAEPFPAEPDVALARSVFRTTSRRLSRGHAAARVARDGRARPLAM